MKIKEMEDNLFKEWSKDYNAFITDGIVDENQWLSSKIKILFILKEANDTHGDSWDLRRYIAEKARSQTWDNIARWTYGIRNLGIDVPWQNVISLSKGERESCLRSIGAMNLKKIPGGHTANNGSIRTFANKNKLFLQKQFDLYRESDLIICCGSIVSDVFHEYIDDFPDYEWLGTTRGVKYHRTNTNKYLIKFVHPEIRVGEHENLIFFGLLDAVREIFNKPKETRG
jgi:hypothetical protein